MLVTNGPAARRPRSRDRSGSACLPVPAGTSCVMGGMADQARVQLGAVQQTLFITLGARELGPNDSLDSLTRESIQGAPLDDSAPGPRRPDADLPNADSALSQQVSQKRGTARGSEPCSPVPKNSNASSNVAVPSRTGPHRADEVAAGPPNIRTDWDGLNRGRACLLIRGFGDRVGSEGWGSSR